VSPPDDGEPIAFGSGFVIRAGLVATNAHVLEDGCEAVAKLPDDETLYTVENVLYQNESLDLAILEIDMPARPVLPLGDSDAVRIGQTVFAVGNPMGLEGTFSVGNVSARRTIEGQSYLQITAPISPGSSGGPVLDDEGRVIGIATLQLNLGQNLNFAIPARRLQTILDSLGSQPATASKPDQPAIKKKMNPVQSWFNKAAPKSQITLYGDDRSHTYYWPWCQGYDTIPAQERTPFPSRADAEAQGYAPADTCDSIKAY